MSSEDSSSEPQEYVDASHVRHEVENPTEFAEIINGQCFKLQVVGDLWIYFRPIVILLYEVN